jgi:hypothetical protein
MLSPPPRLTRDRNQNPRDKHPPTTPAPATSNLDAASRAGCLELNRVPVLDYIDYCLTCVLGLQKKAIEKI